MQGNSKKLSGPSRKNGVIDKCKYRKHTSQRKCTEHEYRVQDINNVTHTSVKFSFATTHFPELQFFSTH